MKKLLFASIILLSCQKENNSGNPLREEIAMNETRAITSNPTFDNHILLVIQHRDTTIATYNNAPITLYVIKTSNALVDKLILKYQQKTLTALGKTIPGASSITYQVTDQGGLLYDEFTTNLQGTLFGNYRLTNAYPVHLWLGGDDQLISKCMTQFFNQCFSSWSCGLWCGVKIWVCSYGWHMECFRRAISG